MRWLYSIPIAASLILTSCNDTNRPNDGTFRAAINRYLEQRGEICTVIDREFPIDLSRTVQSDTYGIGPKLAALAQAGLVRTSNTKAVVHGMLDPLRGPGPAQSVTRYELTDLGRRYFQQVPGAAGQNNGFCYGHKSVDTIAQWTEPVKAGASSQTEVTYTYRIADMAPWAKRSDVQQVFPDIRTTVSGASKTTETIGLELTSKGWEVPGQQ